MGNWHCVPSSCAEVVYQEYLPPIVRWRYPGESWQQIEGDDYSFVQSKWGGDCPGVRYRMRYYALEAVPNNNYTPLRRLNNGQLFTDNFIYNRPIVDVELRNHNNQIITFEQYKATGKHYSQEAYNLYVYVNQSATYPRFAINIYGFVSSWGIEPFDFIPLDPEPANCPKCLFKVTKKGQTVHQETRAVCPEVEKLPCRLSPEIKQIEIEKIPYLEKIEVVPYAYSAYKLPGVPAPIVQADQIPAECLNIYNNAIYVIPPSGPGIYPNGVAFDSFVAQICSAPDCPPPQYQVLCDSCGCENCVPLVQER